MELTPRVCNLPLVHAESLSKPECTSGKLNAVTSDLWQEVSHKLLCLLYGRWQSPAGWSFCAAAWRVVGDNSTDRKVRKTTC